MSLLKKLSITLLVTVFALGFLPLASGAAMEGTITVSVQNEDEDGFSGDWYLHQGTTISGMLIRNGSSSETFDVDTGTYYLEVRGVPNDRPYYYLHSENPQTVDEGETVIFNVQYFETEGEMLTASGNPPAAEEPEQTEEPVGYDIYDQHGCNSTQGYVWCERNESCVLYWSPACKVEEPAEEPVEEEEEPVEATAVLATSPSVHVPTFETAPGVPVPTFETPPPTFEPDVPEDDEVLVLPLSLAQTGPSAALALIPSMLVGLAFLRRRR